MPKRKSLAPCSIKGCPILSKEAYCPTHKPAPWGGKTGFKGYRGAWLKTRKAQLETQPHCQIQGPGCTGKATTVDHITPKSQGGTDNPLNLQSSCNTCHTHKTNQERQKAAKQSQRFNKDCGFL